jgi:hypothetical protein
VTPSLSTVPCACCDALPSGPPFLTILVLVFS